MGSLEQLYQQVIFSHACERHGARGPSGVDTSSHQVSPTCGDKVTLGVTLDGEHLTSLQQDGDGCLISRASLPMMTDLTQGKSAREISCLYQDMEVMTHLRSRGVGDEILGDLGDTATLEFTPQFVNHVKCALLGWYALHDTMAKSGIDISIADEPTEQQRSTHE